MRPVAVGGGMTQGVRAAGGAGRGVPAFSICSLLTGPRRSAGFALHPLVPDWSSFLWVTTSSAVFFYVASVHSFCPFLKLPGLF